MKRLLPKIALIIAIAATVICIDYFARNTAGNISGSIKPVSALSSVEPTLIIDAGHGGIDGGAVSDSGVSESGINLDIAQRLELLMGFFGVPTVMTRDSESISYSEKADSIRSKKNEDIRNRVTLVNSTQNAVLISIHQNKYTSGGPFGAQVLYARTNGSQQLAEGMQSLLISSLNPQNYRAAAKIPGNIYLMNNVSCPAILIECGFLSNDNELRLLSTEEYRLKIAATIAAGYLNCRGGLLLQ